MYLLRRKGIYIPPVIPLNLDHAVIICDGNSKTAGGYPLGIDKYPSILSNLEPFLSGSCLVLNKGVGAQQTSQMIADGVVDIDGNFNPAVSNFVIAWEVDNDIYYNGNVRNAVDRIWEYCDARKAAGFYVGIITLEDRAQDTAAGDSEFVYRGKLKEANVLLKAEYNTHCHFIIDISEDANIGINDSEIPSEWNSYDVTYFADKVHNSTAGYEIIADYVRTALLTFTGNADLI